MTPPFPHWHGYAWTGPRIGLSALHPHTHTRPHTRTGPRDTQPLSPEVQLKRMTEDTSAFTTHRTADEAYAWLEATLTTYPRAATTPTPTDSLTDVRARLDSGGEVDWFYYSLDGRYIERTLRPCTGPSTVIEQPEQHRSFDGCPHPP